MSNPYHYTNASTYGNDDTAASVVEASTGGGGGGGGDVLALGSSSLVNDDLHKTVKEEIVDLDEQCRKAKASLDGEARTAHEIAIAEARADAEMKGLLETGARTLDSVHVGEQILHEIKGNVLQPFHDSKSGGHKTPMDYLAHQSAENWKILKAQRDEVDQRRTFQEEIKGKVLQLIKIMKELRALEADDDDRTAEEERQIAELQAQQEQAEQVLVQEKQRLQALEAAAKDAEVELGKAREMKAEKVAAYEAQKAANQLKRAEWEHQVEQARQRNAGLAKQRSDVAAESEEWNQKGEAAAAHLGQVQALLDERKAHQDAAEATRAERIKVHGDKTALEAELSALHGELDKVNRHVAKEQEKAAKIQQEALATDELYAERCSAALKDELAEMIKHVYDIEMLAKQEQEKDPSIKTLEEDLAATRELIAQCKASTKAALEELKSQKTRVKDQKSALETQRTSLALLAEVRSNNARLEDEIAALKRSVEDKARLDMEREEKMFRLQVYREAAKLLKDTAIQEEQALDFPSEDAHNGTVGLNAQVANAAEHLGGGDLIDSDVSMPPVARLPMW